MRRLTLPIVRTVIAELDAELDSLDLESSTYEQDRIRVEKVYLAKIKASALQRLDSEDSVQMQEGMALLGFVRGYTSPSRRQPAQLTCSSD